MKRFVSFICIISILIITCQTSFSAAKDNVAPTVAKTDPGSNLSTVETNKAITIKFSEQIFKGNTYSRIKLANSWTVSVNIAVTVDRNNSLIIRPKGNLENDTVYELIIPANAVKDKSGNGLKKAYILKFRTEPDSSAFNVKIIQNGNEIKADAKDNAFYLDRSNFSLRCKMPIEGILHMAALDDSDSYDLTKEGMSLEEIPYFIPGTGMAADGPYESLYVNNEAHHYLFYSDDAHSRLPVINEDENSIIDTEFKVNDIQLLDPEIYEYTGYSLDEFPMDNIYIVAVMDLNHDGIINKGEYNKLVLIFN